VRNEKYYTETGRKGIPYVQQKRGRLTGLVTSCVGTAFFNHIIEGNVMERIEVTGTQGRRRKQLRDGLEKTRGYWKLKVEAIDRILRRTRFGRGYGH
jgi:hypothetical protein